MKKEVLLFFDGTWRAEERRKRRGIVGRMEKLGRRRNPEVFRVSSHHMRSHSCKLFQRNTCTVVVNYKLCTFAMRINHAQTLPDSWNILQAGIVGRNQKEIGFAKR